MIYFSWSLLFNRFQIVGNSKTKISRDAAAKFIFMKALCPNFVEKPIAIRSKAG
jgi:hypothetical protein